MTRRHYSINDPVFLPIQSQWEREPPRISSPTMPGDGEFTDVATVTVTITPTNDAPDVVDDLIVVLEGGIGPNELDGGATSLLDNDNGTENNSLTAALETNPISKGTVTLGEPTGIFTYTHNGGEEVSTPLLQKASDGDLNNPRAQYYISL